MAVGVVVTPRTRLARSRAWWCSAKLASGIGAGIEEDVIVVEGAHELDAAREHRVTEAYPRHVADADDGEVSSDWTATPRLRKWRLTDFLDAPRAVIPIFLWSKPCATA